MAAIPLVTNGVITDWSQTEISVAKKLQGAPALPPIRGAFTKLDFDYGIEGRENQIGNSTEPVGQNQGNMAYSSSADVYEAAWKKLITYLGEGFLDVENQVTVSAVYKIDGLTHRVSIQGSIAKITGSWSKGNAHGRSIEFCPTSIRETDNNGNLIKPVRR